jgi:curved DNA-binding protein CbpA
MQTQSSSSPPRARALSYQEIKVMASLILEETDHYAALGVDPEASLEEINESYRIAVQRFHPLNHRAAISNDTVFHWLLSRAFTRLSIAYRIISNPRQRQIYDRALNARRPNGAIVESVEPTSGDYAKDEDEMLKLQSYSFATPEWLSAKRKGETEARERRRVERVKIQIPVTIASEGGWQTTGQTRDLSPLGALLTIHRPVEPGSLLHLQLRMPKQFRTRHYNTEIYTTDARVLRSSVSKPVWVIAVEFI